MKIKQCPLGKTHKWSWVKDVTKKTILGSQMSFKRMGVYRCECGQTKYSTPHSGL